MTECFANTINSAQEMVIHALLATLLPLAARLAISHGSVVKVLMSERAIQHGHQHVGVMIMRVYYKT
jgi:hypothetical protein